MSNQPEYERVTGVVLSASNRAVEFNFGTGPVWVPRCCVKEATFLSGVIADFEVQHWLLKREGIAA